MAETKSVIEREYIIPLRREWLKLPQYRRAGRAVKAIKQFIAKHMKVPERDTERVKISMYLNSEIWFKGRRHPPAKIRVKAVKEGEIVRVDFIEVPEHVKFLKAKHERLHKEVEKKEEVSKEKVEETKEEKAEDLEKKKDEKEKEKSVEEQKLKEAKMQEKVEKHITKVKETQFVRRSMDRH
jgi:large subunit ribosomal protein L31e